MGRLRECPFCHKEVKDGFPYLHFHQEMKKWVFSHYCDHPKGQFHVTIDLYGMTEQECVDKWNGVYEEQVE